MSERYTKLYSLPENLYAEGAPVIVSAGNLLKDNQTGKVLAQLKIKSISPKAIKAATVVIHALDTAGLPLNGETPQEYLDLNVRQGEEFGQKAAIPLPNPSTRGFTVEVSKVIFVDNNIWERNASPLEPLPAPEEIDDPELSKQFEIQFDSPCEVLPRAYKDLWLCACSAWNKGKRCYYCQSEKSAMLNIDLDALDAEKEARLAQEQADRETKAKNKKKIIRIFISLIVLSAAAALVFIKILIPNSNYNLAVSLHDAGQYEEAIAMFQALGNYKDCPERLKEAICGKAQVLAQNEDYLEAVVLLNSLGEHARAKDMLQEILPKIYDAGVLACTNQEFEKAEEYFSFLSASYKDTADYLTRLEVYKMLSPKNGYEYYVSDIYDKAMKIKNDAIRDSILEHDILQIYKLLDGTWTASSHKYMNQTFRATISNGVINSSSFFNGYKLIWTGSRLYFSIMYYDSAQSFSGHFSGHISFNTSLIISDLKKGYFELRNSNDRYFFSNTSTKYVYFN